MSSIYTYFFGNRETGGYDEDSYQAMWERRIVQPIQENMLTLIGVGMVASACAVSAYVAGASLFTVGLFAAIGGGATIAGIAAVEAFCETSGVSNIFREVVERTPFDARDLAFEPDDF